MIKKILFFSVIIVGMFAGSLCAQWSSDTTKNTAVCTALLNEQNPQICSDGSNGAIIVWEDYRNGNWDLYAQKLNSDGVAQWTKDGINICVSTANQTAPVICSDGSGGAYVAWKDTRNGRTDLYAQHINSTGGMVYSATGSSIAVAANATAPDNLAICTDGNGSAFVAWADSRNSISPTSTRPDIWMNKLTANGIAWGAGGISVISQTLGQKSPQLVDDGTGGCFLVWVNDTIPAASICGNRVNAAGAVQWGSLGVRIFSVTSGNTDASRNPQVCRDGSDLCVVWEQIDNLNSSNGWNILCTRIKSDGTNLWNTSTSATDVSGDWTGDQINPVVFPDDSTGSNGHNGMLVVYQSIIVSSDIVMTRVLSDGLNSKPAFPNQLFPVCQVSGDQTIPKAVKTGTGEVLIVWNDTRSNNSTSTYSSIYAQRCDKTPARFLGPTGSTWGVPVSNIVNSNADQVALAPRTNGGIAAWRDNRNGNNDIYAQVIFRDGSLPIELANFSASALPGGQVLVNWETASEKDNAGFEIERRLISDPNAPNTFETLGSYANNASLRGAGNSNSPRNYSFTDQPGKSGVYEYRLIDYSLDGERTTHDPKTVDVGDGSSTNFSASPNMPNPFSDKTIIPVTLATDANVTVQITDILGRRVATPYNNSLLSSGSHDLQINSNGLSAGSYYCKIIVTDSGTGNVIWSSPKAMLMQVVR